MPVTEKYHKGIGRFIQNAAEHQWGLSLCPAQNIPSRLDESGNPTPWEPEESILLNGLHGIFGAASLLSQIDNFFMIPGQRNLTYVTCALNAPQEYSGRLRFHFFDAAANNPNGVHHFTRTASHAAMAFKSRGKNRNRTEYEVETEENIDISDALRLMKAEYGAALPNILKTAYPEDLSIKGLICVERAGFEAIHKIDDVIIHYSGSYDACATARPDLGLIKPPSSIIEQHHEIEIEAHDVFAQRQLRDDEKIEIIEASMNQVTPKFHAVFEPFMMDSDNPLTKMNKTERAIYDSVKEGGADIDRNILPKDLIRDAELRGRLCDLFRELPSPKRLHEMANAPIYSEAHLIPPQPFWIMD